MKKIIIAIFSILSLNLFGQKIESGSLDVFYFQNSSTVSVEWDNNIEFAKGISFEEYSKNHGDSPCDSTGVRPKKKNYPSIVKNNKGAQILIYNPQLPPKKW